MRRNMETLGINAPETARALWEYMHMHRNGYKDVVKFLDRFTTESQPNRQSAQPLIVPERRTRSS